MDTSLLAHIPLFARLSEEERRDLGALLKPIAMKAHQTVCWIGELGTEFYIVQGGLVVVVQPDDQGKEITLNQIGAGGFFGELSLIDGGVRTATVRTVRDSVFLTLGRDAFLRFVEKHPSVAAHVIGELGKRQRGMMQMLRTVQNANEVMNERQTFGHRFADHFASLMGSWTFIIVQSVVYSLWIIANVVLTDSEGRWDAYPFGLLALVLSAVAGYAAPLIMMSQSRQSEKDRIRAELEYQVNVKAHHEVMQLHKKVDELARLLARALPTAAPSEPAGDDLTETAT